MFSRSLFIALTFLAGLTLPTEQAVGQAWPSRPIRFIVPLPPGGSNDILARLFAERMQANLGHNQTRMAFRATKTG